MIQIRNNIFMKYNQFQNKHMTNVHGFAEFNNPNRNKDNREVSQNPPLLEDKLPFVFRLKSDRQPNQETIPYTLKIVCCPDLKLFSISFGYLIAIWVVYVISLLQGVSKKNHEVLQVEQITLLNFGGAIGTLIAKGEVYRLMTASFLHANLMHIITNSLCIILLCSRFQKLYPKQILYVLIVSSITGFLLSVFCNSKRLTVGASTAIFGVLGGFIAYLIINWTTLEPYGQIRSSITCTIGVIVFLGLLFSIGGTIDAVAHIGGLIGGLLIGLAILPGIAQKSKIITYFGKFSSLGLNLLIFLLVIFTI